MPENETRPAADPRSVIFPFEGWLVRKVVFVRQPVHGLVGAERSIGVIYDWFDAGYHPSSSQRVRFVAMRESHLEGSLAPDLTAHRGQSSVLQFAFSDFILHWRPFQLAKAA